MSEQPKPKKPQRRNSKKISLNSTKSWKTIIEEVEKIEVPIDILQEIEVKLIDGTTILININNLLDEGADPEEIESMLDVKFNELDAYIQNVDFLIDIAKVVDTIQPETDKVLKDL